MLAGDINEQSDQPTWQHLAERLTDCYTVSPRGDGFTFPARGPHKRIDAIFAVAGFSVVSCGGIDADPADLVAATDHLPVVAELSHPHPGIDDRLEQVHQETVERAARTGRRPGRPVPAAREDRGFYGSRQVAASDHSGRLRSTEGSGTWGRERPVPFVA